jgi:hypothetical protein
VLESRTSFDIATSWSVNLPVALLFPQSRPVPGKLGGPGLSTYLELQHKMALQKSVAG